MDEVSRQAGREQRESPIGHADAPLLSLWPGKSRRESKCRRIVVTGFQDAVWWRGCMHLPAHASVVACSLIVPMMVKGSAGQKFFALGFPVLSCGID